MRYIFVIFFLFPLTILGQIRHQPDASQIKLKLRKLNFLGSVLYVAAHPDDENTRIIAYLSKDRLAATAYLSLTRGDGGQNLIGPELRDLLGLIRTQELLAARRIDGGEQFFTRANDFGFSKSAEETFQIWGKQNILHDVIKVYRSYQPDVIITRFPADQRAGHGHHIASAMLAQEAFDLSASPNSFPDVRGNGWWTAKRLYTNTGRWWNTKINEQTPGVVTLDVGGYSSLLGSSYSEIAAVSRSQHKSQGFGSRGTRGYQPEFLEYVKGDSARKDIFEGINTTWARIPGGDKVQPLVLNAIQRFDEENPAASLPALFAIRKQISSLDASVWKTRKLKEVEELILDCLGLYAEVTASEYWVVPGEHVQINFEFVNRSSSDIELKHIQSSSIAFDSTTSLHLKNNASVVFKSKKVIPLQTSYSDPYWLKEPHSTGLFTVNDDQLIGKPEQEPPVVFTFAVQWGDEVIHIQRALHYRWTDPVKGELARPFAIVPPVFVNIDDPVMIFHDAQPKPMKLVMKSSVFHPFKGELTLKLPEGWKSEPASYLIELNHAGEEQSRIFQVTPPSGENTGVIQAQIASEGKVYSQSIKTIAYDHIPIQTLLPPATVKAVRLNLKNARVMVGYIKGAGDALPQAMRNMGFDVTELNNDEVSLNKLKKFNAVVLGIRALNANERIKFMMPDLLSYVQEGGTLIVQYNNDFDLETKQFSPYPMTLSRDRVTEEDAIVDILKPDHIVLNAPNKINERDFNGWVQERGLYFPSTWDEHYDAILSMHDKGEDAKKGSLLVAKYGKGYYVYTGLSFFRQLPEGVPGAYKLFSNLVSLGQEHKTEPTLSRKKSSKKDHNK
jgi:LmbE family N-acetylglucosaminyl deacetylase